MIVHGDQPPARDPGSVSAVREILRPRASAVRRISRLRVPACAAAAVALGALAAADLGRTGAVVGAAWLSAAAALALLARPRRGRSLIAGAAVAGSLAATLLYDGPADNRTALWWLAELAASLLTLRLAVRWAPARDAALLGTAAAAAIAVLPLRLTLHVVPPATARGAVLGCALCAVAAAVAAASGLYPRLLAARRSRAVAEARRAQRLDLARDLHDFVAHDVGGLIVQAQAARVTPDPEAARDALRRIEDAGQRVMMTLDRTVHGLHDRPGGLDDLRALAERFAATSGARLSLDIGVGVGELPDETASLAYRLVVEALTNVRRHAPDASRVGVGVVRTPGGVRVAVTSDGRARTDRRSGLGLAGLAERVAAHGGRFAAGPTPDGLGWEVTALLPADVRSRS